MKNILILADGSIAKHFIEWIGRKRVAENRYYVTCFNDAATPEKMGKHITLIKADPTSYARMRKIMQEVKFSDVFIIMSDKEDAQYTLKNIRLIDTKVRIVLLNQWDDAHIGKGEENVTVLHMDELMAAHLYDNLPNVPVIAQNVGLGRGEIMEVHVPFGSTFAFRHVGSIQQRKWKIAAIYRDEKQILPSNATMIRPNDLLLLLGKPMVLDGVYRMINKRSGLFPEPFGKDLYLLLDFEHDTKYAMRYLKESLYLLDNLEEKSLFVRVINPNNFALIEALRAYETDNVTVMVNYDDHDSVQLIEYDIQAYDIGLVLSSLDSFSTYEIQSAIYALRKLVYLFGDRELSSIKECVIMMDENQKMESISSTAFDIADALSMKLCLCDVDPEGEFESHKTVYDHYETLAHIFNMEIDIKQVVANPVRELMHMEGVLQIAPFEKTMRRKSLMRYLSTKLQDFLLTTQKHPKLLVPYAIGEVL